MPDCTLLKSFATVCCCLMLVSACLAEEPPRESGLEALERIAASEPRQPQDDDDEMQRLLIERRNIALEGLQARLVELRQGQESLQVVFDNYRRLFNTELDLCESTEERIGICREALQILESLKAKQVEVMESMKLKRVPPRLIRFRFGIASLKINILRLERGQPMEVIRFNP